MDDDDEIPPVEAWEEAIQQAVNEGSVSMSYDKASGDAVYWPRQPKTPDAVQRRCKQLTRFTQGWVSKTLATTAVAALVVTAISLVSHNPSTPPARAATAFDDPVFRALAAQADTVCQSMNRLVATCVEWDGTRDQVQAWVGPDSFTFVFSYRNSHSGRRERTVLKVFSSIAVKDTWLVLAKKDHKHYPNLIYGDRYAYYGSNKKRIEGYGNVIIPTPSDPTPMPTGTPRMSGRNGALVFVPSADSSGIPKIAISASIAFGWIPEATPHDLMTPLIRTLAITARSIILGTVPPAGIGLPPDPDPNVPPPVLPLRTTVPAPVPAPVTSAQPAPPLVNAPPLAQPVIPGTTPGQSYKPSPTPMPSPTGTPSPADSPTSDSTETSGPTNSPSPAPANPTPSDRMTVPKSTPSLHRGYFGGGWPYSKFWE